jgi:hypothetical protein
VKIGKSLPLLVLLCGLLSAQITQPPEPILKSAGQPTYPPLARAAHIIYPAGTLERAENGAFVPLSRLHSDATITQGNSASYDFWKNKATEEIIESLKPGSAFAN